MATLDRKPRAPQQLDSPAAATGSRADPIVSRSEQIDGTPEAWIYRADFLSSKIYHVRFARLALNHGPVLEIYKGDHLQLEHTFQLAGCRMSEIRGAECDVKPPGVNLIKGYVTGHIETKQLYVLKIKLSKETSLRLSSKVTLGFDSMEEARKWSDAMRKSLGRGSTDPSHVGASTPLERAGRSIDPTLGASGNLEDDSKKQEEPEKPRPLLPEQAPSNPSSRWKSELHWCGLAVYREPASGTYATCCTVHASPRVLFQHMIHLTDGSSAWTFFKDKQVLGSAPGDADGLTFHAQAGSSEGLMGWLGLAQTGHLLPPRDVVVEQTWGFREPSGVFTISYRSVEHPEAPEQEWGGVADYLYHWRSPVRAKIHNLAFTISPLNLSEWNSGGIAHPEDAPECMLTVLVSADLGGGLSQESFSQPVLAPLGLVWLAALIRSIVQVKNTVEQKRFVESLHSLFGDDADAVDDSSTAPLWQRAASFATSAARTAKAAAAAAGVSVPAAAVPASTMEAPSGAAVDAEPAASAALETAAAKAVVEVDGQAGLAHTGLPTVHVEPKSWLPERFFYAPEASLYNVRGPSYLQDKQKQPSAPAAFHLKALEALVTPDTALHISPHLPVVAASSAPFLLAVHFTLPYGGKPMHLVCVFETDRDPTDEDGMVEDEPFARALAEFVAGNGPAADKHRNSMLKMIPKVNKGSWVMKQAVGSTPVIIGTKLATTYHRGPNYLEITVDISSNSTAASITNYVAGAVSSLSICLGFVLEGKRQEHLPERLLGLVCLDHLDMSAAKFVDTSKPPPKYAPPLRSPAATPAASATQTKQPMLRPVEPENPGASSPVPIAKMPEPGTSVPAVTGRRLEGGSANASSTVRFRENARRDSKNSQTPFELVDAPQRRKEGVKPASVGSTAVAHASAGGTQRPAASDGTATVHRKQHSADVFHDMYYDSPNQL